jgi:hypothetical protein
LGGKCTYICGGLAGGTARGGRYIWTARGIAMRIATATSPGSTLLMVPPERRDTNTLSALLARLSYGGEVVIIKSPSIERRFHIDEFIVSPRYNFLRFEARNINEVYKLAKRFGEETLRIVANKTRPVAVLINEAELGPESTCCDVITQRREFWKTFLVHLSENAPALHTVLVCEDIAGRCGPLVDIFDAVVKL